MSRGQLHRRDGSEPVPRVPHDGVSDAIEVSSNLVCSPGKDLYLEGGDLPVGPRAVYAESSVAGQSLGPPDRSGELSLALEFPRYDGEVALTHLSAREGLSQRPQRRESLGHHDGPSGESVETVHALRPPKRGGDGGGDGSQGVEETGVETGLDGDIMGGVAEGEHWHVEGLDHYRTELVFIENRNGVES